MVIKDMKFEAAFLLLVMERQALPTSIPEFDWPSRPAGPSSGGDVSLLGLGFSGDFRCVGHNGVPRSPRRVL